MFNLGGGELLVIALIALIVLGPERLPDAARTIGKVVGEVRKLSTGFQDEVRTAFSEPDEPVSARSVPNSSPLAAAVADLDDGKIEAVRPDGDDAGEASGPGSGVVPATLAPDVADALGEVVPVRRARASGRTPLDGVADADVETGTPARADDPGVTRLDGGEHRAAS